MNSKKATLHDFSRMCKNRKDCKGCKLSVDVNELHIACFDLLANYPDKASEIILKWCKEHSVETKQSKLLKCYPYIPIVGETVDICPKKFDMNFLNSGKCDEYIGCEACKKDYWLAEVEENK